MKKELRKGVMAVLVNALTGSGNQNTFDYDDFSYQVRFRLLYTGWVIAELLTYPGLAYVGTFRVSLREVRDE